MNTYFLLLSVIVYLEIITVSADWPKWVDRKIKLFLEKHNAKFLCFVKDAKDDGAFINALDEKWQGEIPFTFIHAKLGGACSITPRQANVGSLRGGG